MRSGLTLPETILYGLALATSLSVALAHSPVWSSLFDLASLLPARYVQLLGLLPVATNTAFAFSVLLGLTYLSLLVMRHPVVGLSLITGSTLALAAYPYGQLRWHRLFVHLPVDDGEPSIGLWVRSLIPILLLLLIPILLQTRNVVARYQAKDVDDAELGIVRRHMTRLAMQNTLLALGFTGLVGVLLFGSRALASGGGQALVGHSVLIMLLIAFLLVAAIGIGTGVFQKEPERHEQGPTPTRPGSR